jgi:hypothetical protein
VPDDKREGETVGQWGCNANGPFHYKDWAHDEGWAAKRWEAERTLGRGQSSRQPLVQTGHVHAIPFEENTVRVMNLGRKAISALCGNLTGVEVYKARRLVGRSTVLLAWYPPLLLVQ